MKWNMQLLSMRCCVLEEGRKFSILPNSEKGGSVLHHAEDEITVGHWTFSEHLWDLSEQKSICSAKLSERRMHNRSAKLGCEVSTWLHC